MGDWPHLCGQAVENPTTLLGLVSAVLLLAVGALVWTVKRTIDKTIPDQQTLFSQQMEKAQATFAAAIKESWDAHAAQLAAEREDHRQRIEADRTFHREQVEGDRKFFADLLATLIGDTRKAHAEVLAELKRHAEALESVTEAIRENQAGIMAAVRVSEEHHEAFVALATEWRDVNAAARRRARAARSGSGEHRAVPTLPGGSTTT